eukprot:1717805-Prymnesium_polylepis.1
MHPSALGSARGAGPVGSAFCKPRRELSMIDVCVLTGYEDEGRERGTRARRASDKEGMIRGL